MKIISKFTDYYDKAQGLGYDERLLYVRETVAIPESRYHDRDELNAVLLASGMGATSIHQAIPNLKDFPNLEIGSGVVYLGGKPHPYLLAMWSDPQAPAMPGGSLAKTWKFIYSKDEALKFLSEVEEARKKQGMKENHYRYEFIFNSRKEFREEAVKALFSQAKSCESWAISKKIPVVVYGYTTGRNRRFQGHASCFTVDHPEIGDLNVFLNPRLADFEFYRAMPAPQVYQEIEMFLGNIAAPDKCPVELSEKDRIQQHGFDKLSFRKAPTKPGGKRRKREKGK